jgi:hypothetical protein
MSAPAPAPTMANVFNDDGKYLGVVFARGLIGFEAFDAAECSLGLRRSFVSPAPLLPTGAGGGMSRHHTINREGRGEVGRLRARALVTP